MAKRSVRRAREPPRASGDTGTNVARGALATEVRGLAETTETCKLALETTAARAAALERVRAQRVAASTERRGRKLSVPGMDEPPALA
jgi:hypothetical protein